MFDMFSRIVESDHYVAKSEELFRDGGKASLMLTKIREHGRTATKRSAIGHAFKGHLTCMIMITC